MTTARMRLRVVCTLCETMASLLPASAFRSVDLPALVGPMMAQNPQRVSSACTADAFAREKGGRGRLFRRAFGRPRPDRRRARMHLHLDGEVRSVVGTFLGHHAIARDSEGIGERPFLQEGF